MKKLRQRISRAFGEESSNSSNGTVSSVLVGASGGDWKGGNIANGNIGKGQQQPLRQRFPAEEGIIISKPSSTCQFFPGSSSSVFRASVLEANPFPAFFGQENDAGGIFERTAPTTMNGAAGNSTSSRYRWSLSDSMSQLSGRLGADIIVEEDNVGGEQRQRQHHQQQNGDSFDQCNKMTTIAPVKVVMRPKKQQQQRPNQSKTKSWHASRWFGNVVHAATASLSSSSSSNANGNALKKPGCPEGKQSGGPVTPCGIKGADASSSVSGEYVPNVRLRNKNKKAVAELSGAGGAAATRRLSQLEVQKRLSLPAYVDIPQSVLDRLSRAPTPPAESRKSRRASLSEIGFGKAETYRKIVDLGEGTYATVFLGHSLLTGKSVALKEIRLEHEEGAPCTGIREVSLLRHLRHANIVTLHDVVHTDSVLTLVFEYVEQDLRQYMEQLEQWMCIANVRLFLVQLLRGLAYCHAKRILHRDLKPQNLLITQKGELKLADFGLARAQSIPTKCYSSEVVTLWYRPPDVLLGSTDYSTHIDMWGVGCILYEMLAHKAMFPGNKVDEQLDLIFRRLGTPTPRHHPELCALPGFRRPGVCALRRYSPKGLLCLPSRITQQRADLLQKLLAYEGKQRLSAQDAMRHPFLRCCFPDALFALSDADSVLSVPGLTFVRERKAPTAASADDDDNGCPRQRHWGYAQQGDR